MNYEKPYIPSIIDFAYEIIGLHEENKRLRNSLDHYKDLDKIHTDHLKTIDDGNAETMGIILNAVLDPDSSINKADRIIIENGLKEV